MSQGNEQPTNIVQGELSPDQNIGNFAVTNSNLQFGNFIFIFYYLEMTAAEDVQAVVEFSTPNRCDSDQAVQCIIGNFFNFIVENE